MSAYAEDERYEVRAGRLWAAGIATAVVAGLAAQAGLIVIRRVLGDEGEVRLRSGLPLLDGPYLIGAAGFAALIATALLQLLLLSVPRAARFFASTVLLVTAMAVLLLLLAGPTAPLVGLALLTAALGIVISGALSGVVGECLRTRTEGPRTDRRWLQPGAPTSSW